MTEPAALYDFMAERFRQIGQPVVPLEDLIEAAEDAGHGDIWDMPRHGIVNAMRFRGLEVKAGNVMLPTIDGEHFDPVATDYAEFIEAAQRVLREAMYPIDTPQLMEMVALSTAAIPLSTMRHRLRKIGIHYIPGVGYWKHPQYTDPSGRIISRRIRSDRIQALHDCFEAYGWPIAGPDAERWTSGLVTSRFLTTYAANAGKDSITGIGKGLYVPSDRAEGEFPMSRGVALSLLALDPRETIDDKDHLRLFRLCLMLEERELASLKRSRTTRDRIRRQTLKVELKSQGRAMLEKIARKAVDEF